MSPSSSLPEPTFKPPARTLRRLCSPTAPATVLADGSLLWRGSNTCSFPVPNRSARALHIERAPGRSRRVGSPSSAAWWSESLSFGRQPGDGCAFHGCRWSPGWGSAEALAQSGRGSPRDRRQHRPRPPQLPLGFRLLPPVRHTIRRPERVKTRPSVGTRRVPPRRRMVTTQLPRLRWRPPLAPRTAFCRLRIRTTTITDSVPCAMRSSGGLPVSKPMCFFAKANSTSRTGSWRSARGGRSSRSISLRCESDLANWGAASIREGSHSGC